MVNLQDVRKEFLAKHPGFNAEKEAELVVDWIAGLLVSDNPKYNDGSVSIYFFVDEESPEIHEKEGATIYYSGTEANSNLIVETNPKSDVEPKRSKRVNLKPEQKKNLFTEVHKIFNSVEGFNAEFDDKQKIDQKAIFMLEVNITA